MLQGSVLQRYSGSLPYFLNPKKIKSCKTKMKIYPQFILKIQHHRGLAEDFFHVDFFPS